MPVWDRTDRAVTSTTCRSAPGRRSIRTSRAGIAGTVPSSSGRGLDTIDGSIKVIGHALFVHAVTRFMQGAEERVAEIRAIVPARVSSAIPPYCAGHLPAHYGRLTLVACRLIVYAVPAHVREGEVVVRAVLLSCLLVLASVSIARGQTGPSTEPSLSVTPATGGLTTAHQVQIGNMISGAPILILFAPDGTQAVLHPDVQNGLYVATLNPPDGGWMPGLYRVVLGLAGGAAMSQTFTAGTGPSLYVAPPSPSPTSVFNIVGTNLPPNSTVSVHLFLTGGIQGERVIPVLTDASGAFSAYVWPEPLGFSFFPAGSYLATLPDFGLSAPFTAREHPVSATITAATQITSGQPLPIHFIQYQPYRYLWGVYAGGNGLAEGEFLAGPTDQSEVADLTLSLPALAAGQYYLATPYDWGETTFTVADPPTSTPTATDTPTPTLTPTVTPKPARVPTKVATKAPTRVPTKVTKPPAWCKKLSKKARKKKKACRR
jgi:hypothetical protein